jgi:hypothetical protein
MLIMILKVFLQSEGYSHFAFLLILLCLLLYLSIYLSIQDQFLQMLYHHIGRFITVLMYCIALHCIHSFETLS